MRFRAEQHLRRPSEIRAVREHGQRLDCRAFTVWWKPRDPITSAALAARTGKKPATSPRLCVVASAAAVGGAVRRNRAKRRLREVFRRRQAELSQDCDVMMVARAAATEWPMADLDRRFAEACQRIGSAPRRP